MQVIGLMSGTSVDSIDSALIRIDGSPPYLDWELLAFTHSDYTPQLQEAIFECFQPETSSVEQICRLNFNLGAHLARPLCM